MTAGTTFLCTLVLRNSGIEDLTGVMASAPKHACTENFGCMGFLPAGFPFSYVSAEPDWTIHSEQYDYPFWQPLGSGQLAAGRSSTIVVTVAMGRIGGSGMPPDHLPSVCLTGWGVGAQSGQRLNAHRCLRIQINDPELSTTPGDVNCDRGADSRDALVVLQKSAGLLPFLACPGVADVSGDGDITAIDAALILQFDAGLLNRLPT